MTRVRVDQLPAHLQAALGAPKRKRTTRHAEPERGMQTVCHTCQTVLVGPGELRRHGDNNPGHNRYESVTT